jgi:hypothetical protein
MLQGSYMTIDNHLPQTILLSIRAMSVGTRHCESKREMSAKKITSVLSALKTISQ